MTGHNADRYARGTARLKQVDGAAGEAVITALQDIAPDLARYIIEYPFGDVYARPGLDLKQRQIATIAMLGALGTATPQLKVHIHAARNVGLSKEEIIEVCIQLSVFAGFPAAINAVLAAKEVFAAEAETTSAEPASQDVP
ncbi:MAG: carboxymuconolactone decarboxylase family protein [Pseudomonadota bacterium]